MPALPTALYCLNGGSEEIISGRCDGARLPCVFCADGADECAVGNADQGSVSLQQYFEKAGEGLSAGLHRRGVRYVEAHLSRQTFRAIQSASDADAGRAEAAGAVREAALRSAAAAGDSV